MADPKELAIKHFEKAILAGFGAWFVVSFLGMLVPPSVLADSAKLQEKLDAIKSYMDTTEPRPEGSVEWVSDLKKAVDPSGVRTVDAKSFPTWIAHRRPNLAFDVEGEKARPQPVHAPPHDFQGAITRGRVDLSWTIAGSDENAYIIIDAFEVQRRDLPPGGSPPGQWVSLGVLRRNPTDPAPPTTWVDDKVAPRARYEYQLIETAVIDEDNNDVRKYKLKLPDMPKAPVTREVQWQMDKETPRDVYIVPAPDSVQIPTPEQQLKGDKPKVTLKVYKFANGAFVEKQYFNVLEGAKNIGQQENVRGQKIDFSTGAELLEVRSEERELTVGGQKIKRQVGVIKIKWPGVEQPEEQDEVNLPDELQAQKRTAPPPAPTPKPTPSPSPTPTPKTTPTPAPTGKPGTGK